MNVGRAAEHQSRMTSPVSIENELSDVSSTRDIGRQLQRVGDKLNLLTWRRWTKNIGTKLRVIGDSLNHDFLYMVINTCIRIAAAVRQLFLHR